MQAAQAHPSAFAASRLGAATVHMHPAQFIHRDAPDPTVEPEPVVSAARRPQSTAPVFASVQPVSGPSGSMASIAIGLALLIADSVPSLFGPMIFFLRQRRLLIEAAIYLVMPSVFTWFAYQALPELSAVFPLSTLHGALYATAVFAASCVVSCFVLAGFRGIATAFWLLFQAAHRRHQQGP